MGAKTPLCLAFICAAALLAAQGQEGGLISGHGWGLLVATPGGWVRDTQAIPPAGVDALFRKAGERYSPFGLSISLVAQDRDPGNPGTFAEFLAAQKAALLASDAGVEVRDLKDYAPGLGYRFAMRELEEPGKGFYQAIAYYDGNRAFFSLVLSCRSAEERDRERSALVELLDSFVYLSQE